jgi:hypothetical protein
MTGAVTGDWRRAAFRSQLAPDGGLSQTHARPVSRFGDIHVESSTSRILRPYRSSLASIEVCAKSINGYRVRLTRPDEARIIP